MTAAYPSVETTIDVTAGRTTVRLWINRSEIPENPVLEYQHLVREVRSLLRQRTPHRALVRLLSITLNLNAVQVIRHGWRFSRVHYGTIVYTVPFEDVHG